MSAGLSSTSVTYSDSAAIVKRLGDELIKDPQTAFFELIKNAYDADATEVTVTFSKTTSKSGKIVIEDDGSGMTEEDIETKWTRVAGENKRREPYTPILNRRRLGEKGVGRFSLGKLGDRVKVTTRPRGELEQLVFKLDFGQFTDDRDLGEVELNYKRGTPRQGFEHGTILEISELHDRWGEREIAKIRNELSHLVDPEDEDRNFVISFRCSDFPDLEGRLDNPIAGEETHLVRFAIDEDGAYHMEFTTPEKEWSSEEARAPLSCGPVRGVLRYYKGGVKVRDRHLTAEQDDSHMGVKVYRDGCRVRPYGEPEDDWLEVNARGARSRAAYRVRPQYLAGSVYISAETNPDLADATNREAGMIENDAFEEFHDFVREHVDRLHRRLDQEVKSEGERQRREQLEHVLDTVVDCLNREKSDVYREHVAQLDRSRRGENRETTKKQTTRVTDRKRPSKREWQCDDCGATWRALKTDEPTICMEFAVDREGRRRNVTGCGSTNIDRSTHARRSGVTELSGIVSGNYALVGGTMLKVRIDDEMGENDEEYEVDSREIVINGNHRAFQLAASLDQKNAKKVAGSDGLWPAQTVHIAKCVALAWAELHFRKSERWDDYRERYQGLRDRICESVMAELGQ